MGIYSITSKHHRNAKSSRVRGYCQEKKVPLRPFIFPIQPMLGLSPRSNGYAGVFGYTTVVGNYPNEAQRQCLQDLQEAYRITKSNLQPGIRGKDLDAVTREFLVQHGYEQYLVCPFVHTIGLMEAEGPFFGSHSEDTLQPGMTVCIDVSVFGVPEVHGVRFESGYLITEWGAEPLSPFMEGKILA